MKQTNITFISCLMFLMFSFTNAHSSEIESTGIVTNSSGVDLERLQVEKIVDKMIKSGRISREQGDNARREIASISNQNIDMVKNTVSRKIASTELDNR